MITHLIRAGVLLLALFAVAISTASAGIISQTVRVGGSLPSLSADPIDKFDSSLGELSAVRLDLSGIVLSRFLASVDGPNTQDNLFFNVATTISVDSYLGSDFSGRGTAYFEPLNDSSGDRSTVGLAYAYALGTVSTAIIAPELLDNFKSNAPTSDELSLSVTSTPLSSSAIEIASTMGYFAGELSVSYYYDELARGAGAEASNAAVPEPSTFAILCLGAVVMARSRRRSRSKASN